MIRSALTSLMASLAGDPSQTRYSGLYNDRANRAQEQFALDSKTTWKDTTWTSASGDATYALPSDFMWEKYVLFNGLPLTPISRDKMHSLSTSDDWTDDTGTPTHYIVDPEEAAKQLLLYPIPQGDDASKTISMRYFALPAEMTADSDIPLNSSALLAQFHAGVAAYGAWLLLASEPFTPELSAKMASLLAIYNDAVTNAVDTFRNTASETIRMTPKKSWA